jgi:hypothetical protein
VLPKPSFIGRKPKIFFIPQGTRAYAKENKKENQSAAYGDCQFLNKNFTYIAREVWIVFDISKSMFIPQFLLEFLKVFR